MEDPGVGEGVTREPSPLISALPELFFSCLWSEMLTHSLCHLSLIFTVRVCNLQACGEQNRPPSSLQSLPPPAGVYILVRDVQKLGLWLLGAPPPAARNDSTMGDRCHRERDAQCLKTLEEDKDSTQGRGHGKCCPERLHVNSVESERQSLPRRKEVKASWGLRKMTSQWIKQKQSPESESPEATASQVP